MSVYTQILNLVKITPYELLPILRVHKKSFESANLFIYLIISFSEKHIDISK